MVTGKVKNEKYLVLTFLSKRQKAIMMYEVCYFREELDIQTFLLYFFTFVFNYCGC